MMVGVAMGMSEDVGLDNVQNADICDNYPLVKPEEKPSVIVD